MDDPLLATPEEERSAMPRLYDLIEEGLRDLAARINYLHASWNAPTDEGKAQFSWCLLLGVLTHDVVSSMVDLIRADRLRAAQILARCLFEYELRLWIYREDPAEALRDNEQAPKELRRFFEGQPRTGTAANRVSAEQMAHLDDYIRNNQGRVKTRDVWADVLRRAGGDKDKAQFLYLGRYGFSSSFVHGSGLAFPDVIRTEGKDTFINWRSTNLRPYTLLLEAAFRLIKVVELVETTSGRFQAHVVLERKYSDIIASHSERFHRTLETREARITTEDGSTEQTTG